MKNVESIGHSGQFLERQTSAEVPASRFKAHLYRLKFQEENGRPAKDVEFEAEDSHQALVIAHQEARTRSAELWQDGQKLCSIRRTKQEVWEIQPKS